MNREEWGRREEIGGKGRGMGEIRRREVTRMRERGRRKRERKREKRKREEREEEKEKEGPGQVEVAHTLTHSEKTYHHLPQPLQLTYKGCLATRRGVAPVCRSVTAVAESQAQTLSD